MRRERSSCAGHGRTTIIDTDPGAPPLLTAAQLGAYLERLGIGDRPEPSAEWLEQLHVAHLLAVPFENLDLHVGGPIRLTVDGLHDKLVRRGRGGFCYELNGLFASLLATVGFDVTLVSSRVWTGDGYSPAFDHLALLVDLERTWLADVGFGDAFLHPRPLGATWSEPGRRLRTTATDRGWWLEAAGSDDEEDSDTEDGDASDEGNDERGDEQSGRGWTPVYLADPTPRSLDEFQPRCRWHETSPDSHFQRRRLVSRATPRGRVTVTDSRLIVTEDGERREEELADRRARQRALRIHFGSAVGSRPTGDDGA